MTSPTAIQDRLKALLEPHFTGVTVLTQKPANIENMILSELGKMKYIVLISVPGGREDNSTRTQLVLKQTFRLSLVQSALYTGVRILLDDLMTAMGAIHGEPVVDEGKGPLTFAVQGHQLDASAPGLNIQHIDVEVKTVVTKPTPPPPAP